MILLNLIAAADNSNGIGLNGSLPWFFPLELKYFARVTTQTFSEKKMNAVIMGRKTWISIPKKPLKNRVNIVVSSTIEKDDVEGAYVYPTFAKALQHCSLNKNIESAFVIGGVRLYQEFLSLNWWNKIFLTRVEGEFECDTFLPELEGIEGSTSPLKSKEEVNECDGNTYKYKHFVIEYSNLTSV